ncbi:MAG: hypothetical protein U1E54_03810 [Candidatus Levybacteria bacterium]|nr:hypothetical protein [Candidatus Levybacteria bacterium]
MSRYKQQQIDYLKQITLTHDSCLSIGKDVDDRGYFKAIDIKEWKTLDNDRNLGPDIWHDMNKELESESGFNIDDKFLGYFDLVLALNLWEYIYNPIQAHRNIADFLKQGGTYIGSYPFVYPTHRPDGTDYLRYTPEGVEKLLKVAGLTLIKHEVIMGNELLADFYQSEGMKARQGFNHLIVGSIVTARKG